MTKSAQTPLPSDGELDILKVLWQHPSATAKEIHQKLNAGKKHRRVLTTTAKLLQIMLGKGLAKRDESTWPHTYSALVTRDEVRRRSASQTLKDVFDKSASQFVLSALESGSVSSAEIAEIESILEAYKEKRNNV